MRFRPFVNMLLIGVISTSLLMLTACHKRPPKTEPAPAKTETTQPADAGQGKSKISEDELYRQQYEKERAEVLRDIRFDFDSANIRDDSRSVLEGIGKWMSKRAEVKLTVEGHCDERGSQEYNLALGERRAAAVKSYLVSYGIDANRLKTISYGEEMPLDPGHGEDAWAKNRRAHFKTID